MAWRRGVVSLDDVRRERAIDDAVRPYRDALREIRRRLYDAEEGILREGPARKAIEAIVARTLGDGPQ